MGWRTDQAYEDAERADYRANVPWHVRLRRRLLGGAVVVAVAALLFVFFGRTMGIL